MWSCGVIRPGCPRPGPLVPSPSFSFLGYSSTLSHQPSSPMPTPHVESTKCPKEETWDSCLWGDPGTLRPFPTSKWGSGKQITLTELAQYFLHRIMWDLLSESRWHTDLGWLQLGKKTEDILGYGPPLTCGPEPHVGPSVGPQPSLRASELYLWECITPTLYVPLVAIPKRTQPLHRVHTTFEAILRGGCTFSSQEILRTLLLKKNRPC